MPLTVNSWVQNTAGTSNAVATSLAAHDVALAFCVFDASGSQTVTWPSGFTQLKDQLTTTDGQYIAVAIKKDCTGSEGTLNFSSASYFCTEVIGISGADNTTQPDVTTPTPGNNNTAGTSPWTVSASITPTTNGSMICAFMGSDIKTGFGTTAHTFSDTGGLTWTTEEEINDSGGYIRGGIGHAVQTTAAATTVTGTGTATGATSGCAIILVAIRPAGGGSDVTVAMTGQAATFTAGTLTHSTSKALTGTSASFTAGTLSAAVPRLGRSYVPGPGISPDYRQLFNARNLSTFIAPAGNVTVNLTGQRATFAAGILTPNVTVALTGASASFTSGQLIAAPQLGLTGSSATYAAGQLAVSIDTALVGSQVVFSQGQMGVPGDVTVALTGQRAVFTGGTVTAGSLDNDIGGDPPRRRKTRNVIKDGKFIKEKVPSWPFEQPVTEQPMAAPSQEVKQIVQNAADADIVHATISLLFEIL